MSSKFQTAGSAIALGSMGLVVMEINVILITMKKLNLKTKKF